MLPPTADQQAAAAQAAAQFRAELAERRAAERPLREVLLAALAAAGRQLPDVIAALDCECSCHPRVELDLHDGGASCSCQLTDEQRAAARQELFAALAELSPAQTERATEEDDELAARAAELGAQARIAVGGAPFVLAGLVDGRGFYLRERHGTYRVTVSGDDDPASDPWLAESSVLSYDIADGSEDAFDVDGVFRVSRALDVAVGAVRSFLRQRSCDHRRTVPGDRFCAECGMALRAPELS